MYVGDLLESMVFRVRRKVLAVVECARYLMVTSSDSLSFTVVSCERNAGDFALKCLDSVYGQNYARERVRHIFIDDASDDGTHEKIAGWLQEHPDHSVQYIHNQERRGGTLNTISGMRMGRADSVVIELNGDDWLPDPRVFDFYGRVYADPSVWMTYNSLRVHKGPPVAWARRFSKRITDDNAFRDQTDWHASHLHTFRRKLFDHVREETFIDPETGRHWDCADDQALYLSMLELAGRHSRHINRITCVYNFWEASHCYHGSERSVATAARIRKLPRYQPLTQL